VMEVKIALGVPNVQNRGRLRGDGRWLVQVLDIKCISKLKKKRVLE
jgi:hypothetical protein